MPGTSPLTDTYSKPAIVPSSLLDRLWPYLLLSIAIGASVPMLVRGAHEFINYDGYWHVFIAMQDRWKLFLFEYKNNAHPPIFLLLLRVVTRWGSSRLMLRSISIGAGVGSVLLIGIIARKLCRNQLFALLAAGAYGLSITMLGIALEVRSYSLCLFFMLLAFYFLVDLLDRGFGPETGRSLLLWSLFTTLAIGTEYYAIFFLFACLGALLLFFVFRGNFRQAFLRWIAQHSASVLLSLLLPFATVVYFYRSHIRHQPTSYGHVIDYYWQPGSSVVDFVLRNLRADLNFVLPAAIPSTAALLAFLTITLTAVTFFALFRASLQKTWLAVLPVCVALLLLVELIVASLARRYPFGGLDRQQSILFPFLFLAGFILLDQAARFISYKRLHGVAVAGLAILIGAHFVLAWQKLPRSSQELFSDEFRSFESKLAPAQAIYLDQLTLINFFIQTHDWVWKFRRHLHEPNRVDEYELIPPSGAPLVLFRNLDAWNFDLHDPSMYRVLANAMRDCRLTTANLLLDKQTKAPDNTIELAAEEREIRKLASEAGLKVAFLFDNKDQADVAFLATADAH